MKKEELIALGIEEDTAKQIMALHGKTVTTLKSTISAVELERDNLQGQLTSTQSEITNLKESVKDNPDLTSKITTLETELNKIKTSSDTELANAKKEFEIRLALREAKAHDEKIVLKELDKDTIKLTENGLQGLKEQIESLRESKSFLFQPEAKPEPDNPTIPQIFTKGNPQTTPAPTGDLGQQMKSEGFNLTKFLTGENK